MRSLVTLISTLLIALLLSGCLAKAALAQEHPAATEPAPHAQSTEAQTEPKAEAEKGGEHHPVTTEEKKEEGGEDAEAALKQSAMVKKFGSLLGIKDPATAYWVFTLINFAILALAIIVPAKRALPGIFRSRTANIQKSMEDARKASEEANARLSDIQSRLGRIDAEITSMRATAEEQGRAEEQRLLAATEEEKKKIMQAAEQEIAAASAAAQRELQQFAAELAVNLAEKRIAVSEDVDRHLVREFTQSIGDGRGGRA